LPKSKRKKRRPQLAGALILSRLAQVISERKVQGGVRPVLLTQAKPPQWLTSRRFEALGAAASI
jgi:hypothetical protein